MVQCPDHLIYSKAPSEKPLLLYDGECWFCLRWIRRWEQRLDGKVDVAPFQHRTPHERLGSIALAETGGNLLPLFLKWKGAA